MTPAARRGVTRLAWGPRVDRGGREIHSLRSCFDGVALRRQRRVRYVPRATTLSLSRWSGRDSDRFAVERWMRLGLAPATPGRSNRSVRNVAGLVYFAAAPVIEKSLGGEPFCRLRTKKFHIRWTT